MTSITFHGGVNEIGGNKFLIEDRDTRIFLDFGKNFSKESHFFENNLKIDRKLEILLNLKLLPHLAGLYKNQKSKYSLDGIIISHPHLDHYDYIRYLKDDYPIYCGEETKSAILARDFSSPDKLKFTIGKISETGEPEIMKQFKTFTSGKKIQIGDISFTPYHVDHSAPGSYGFIIETSEGNMVYTGDLRLQGPKREFTENFIHQAKEFDPEVLLIEGTNIAESNIASEEEVQLKVSCLTRSTENLVIAGFNPMDIDRLMTFYDAATENNRKLAISMQQAFFVEKLKNHSHLGLFKLDDHCISIFIRENNMISTYEKEIINKYPNNLIDAKSLISMNDQYVLVSSFYDIIELSKIKPPDGSIYILSQSEPFNEEKEINYDKILNWLNYLGLPLYQVHASGHIMPHEIKNVVNIIGPKKVTPIHTPNPDLFKKYIQN